MTLIVWTRCPVEGCRVPKLRSECMCKFCWSRVPDWLRDAIFARWCDWLRRGGAPPGPYDEALTAAVRVLSGVWSQAFARTMLGEEFGR